ncbi:hypothetical protein FSP39_025407 [Pinctada imbricata]|uniref:Uncharacterized protein n=1 Tax=Pinctada imbricata TaxID=66713 RepID=A0AA88Y8G6_PINIB|nr:hypothetical protein FSP39_025407 [Pinctada imbricata]
MSFAPSAPSETTRSKYFTTKKGVNTQRPSTRSHSENTGNTSVSSTSDENERILSDLEEIKNAIKSTVKTSELEEIRSDIKSTVKKDDLKNIVTSMVKELMKEQRKEFDHKIKEANDLNRKERSKMQDEIDKLRLENEDLRENLSAKRAEIGELRDISEAAIEKASEARRWANYNQQYSRKNNVKVYGLQEVRGENTGDEVIKLLKDKSDTTLLPEEIVAAHRIPGAPNQPRPVIVKLKNSDVKSRVIKQPSTIKSAKIGVRLADDVTRENSKLMERLNEHDMIESCWFFNGSVFGKVNGSERKVKFDIDDVIAERIRASKRRK